MSESITPVAGEPVVEVLTSEGPIRRFVDSGIQDTINRAVATLGDKKIAVIGTFNSKKEAMLVTTFRMSKEWTIVGALDHKSQRGWEGQAAIMWSR